MTTNIVAILIALEIRVQGVRAYHHTFLLTLTRINDLT